MLCLTPYCKLGIRGLDEVLKEGLPRGSTILVAGNPGVGKTTFAAQFIYRGIVDYGEPGVYVSFTEPRERFYPHMAKLGMDFSKLEREGTFRFVQAMSVSSKKIATNILLKVLDIIKEIDAKRLAVDSVTPLLRLFDVGEARAFFEANFLFALRPLKVTTLLVAELPFGSDVIGHGFEEFSVDVVFVLKLDESRGIVKRLLEVRKVREADIPRVVYEFVISKGGITVYTPLDVSLAGGISERKLPTGIKGLDEILRGGVFEKSVTLISGESGTGKTVLCTRVACERARQGDKVVYVSFEEPTKQVEFFMKKVASFKDLRNIEIYAINPSLYTPGALYNFFLEILEESKPNFLVLDGMTALEMCFEKAEFIELARNLILLAKKYGVTLWMTSLYNLMVRAQPEVCTLADNIIALWFDKSEQVIRRKIVVLKQRGSDHSTRVHELVIKHGIVEVR